MSQSATRSQNYLKQLKGSIVYKFLAMLAGFLALPVTIRYLGVEQFGIWSTMLTLVTWVMLFDFGIGNGLKNKISESLVGEDSTQTVRYISTAYGLFFFVAITLFCVFLVVSLNVSWQKIFNTQVASEADLKKSVIILGIFVFLNFWIGLISQVYHGFQRSSVIVLGQCASSVIALVLVVVLYLYSKPAILNMVIVYGLAIVAVNLGLTVIFFRSRPAFAPSMKLFDKAKVSSLLTLGANFFILQFAALMVFFTDKILIAQLLGPEHIAPYEVLYKLFSVITILHGLVLVPLWPAYSDAFQRNDLAWIRLALRKQLKIALCLFAATLIMAVFGPMLVALWIGGEVKVDFLTCFLFSIFICISVWNNVFVVLINATGFLAVSVIANIVIACVNVPLAIFLVRNVFSSIDGVLLATIISLTLGVFLAPYQCHKIIAGAGGIWRR